MSEGSIQWSPQMLLEEVRPVLLGVPCPLHGNLSVQQFEDLSSPGLLANGVMHIVLSWRDGI